MGAFFGKFSFALALSLCFSSSPILGQSYWGATTLSGATNEAIDVESDALGNQYVTGYFSGGTSFQLGASQLNSIGNTDIYVSKYSSTGTLIWVKTFGGSFSDKPSDLAIDNLGNLLITGEFFGQINFGGTTLNSVNASKDIFILKLDNNGNVLWANSEGGAGSEIPFGIATDATNNVIITGQFQGNSNIGGSTLTSLTNPNTSTPDYDLFISKYTDLGVDVWVKPGIGKFADRGLAVSVDAQDNVFLTGQFSDTFSLAGTTINNTDLNVGLVAKINSTGTLQWINLLKAGTVIPYDIMVNSSDEPVIIGDFTGPMQYIQSASTTSIAAPNSKKIFALKIGNSGNHIWNKTFSSDSDISARAIAIDAAKNVFITGYFECAWTEFQTGANPSATFNSAGYKDPYLIAIDNSGVQIFVKTFGGNKNDVGLGIAFDNQQNPVVCGSYSNDLHIPTGAGTYQNTPSPFNLTIAPPSPYQASVYLPGDLTANSFLTNALHSATPDNNYFIGTPVDSLNGYITPFVDTVHFCNGVDLFYNSRTAEDQGPGYTYLWSNGGTLDQTFIFQSGTYTVEVQREDGCAAGSDTIVGVLDPTPPTPLMNDNLGIAVNSQNYPSYNFCAPDSVSIWYSNLCPSCTILISPIGINDTLPHYYTQSGIYSVAISNGLCTSAGSFEIVIDSTTLYDSLELYLYFAEDTDQNDTIQICQGDLLTVYAYDSISNPPLPILNQFHDEPIDSYYFVTQNSLTPYLGSNNNPFFYNYIPDTSGWYVFQYYLSTGYDNFCGIDTIAYLITDSVFIDLTPTIGSNISIISTDSLCPSSSTFLVATPSYASFIWSGPNIVFLSSGNDSAQVAAPGIYSYQGSITDTVTGCTSYTNATFELEEKQPPSILTNPIDGIICPGDSVLLQVQDVYISYNWVDPSGNSPSNTNTLMANTSGFYYCNVVDSNGCTLSSTPAELNQYSTPSISAGPQNIVCENTPLTISVNSSGSPNITWINPSTGGSADQITVTQPGTYICEMTHCGITTTDSVSIIDGSFSINLTASQTLLCYNDTAVLAVDTGYTYDWLNLPDSINTIQATTTGYYSVVATNQFGCEAYSDTLLIISAPFAYPPIVNDVTLCYGDSTTLIDNGFTVVYWYDQDTNLLLTSPTYTTPPLFQSQTIFAGYNALGCPPTFDDVQITVIQPLLNNSIIGDTILCAGDSTNIELLNNIGPVDWAVDNILSTNDTLLTIYGDPGLPIQQILVTNNNACFSDSLTLNVYTIPIPQLSVTPDTITICGFDTQTANAITLVDSIVWITPFGLEYGTSIEISQTYPNGTLIQVQAFDTNSCISNTESILVRVTDTLDIIINSSPTFCLTDFVTLSAIADANQYVWSGPFGLEANDEITFQLASNEGQYTVTVTDSLGCIWEESTEVSAIGDELPSLPDTINCFTEWLAFVSTDSIYTYSDGSGLDFDTISMLDNSTYTIMATNSFGCEISQSVYLLNISCDFTIPNVISVNGDGINDFFTIDLAFTNTKDHLQIFNRWGNLVYDKTGYLNQWNGDDLVDGVYFYLYTWDTTQEEPKVSQGFVTIVR